MLWLILTASTAGAAEILSVEVDAGRRAHGVVTGVVDAPLDRVRDVILDCDRADGWFPDMLESTLVASFEDGHVCGGATDLPWPLADRTWQIQVGESDEPGSAGIWFDYVAGTGDLEALEGGYTLSAMEDGRTLVRYEATVDLGCWIPGPLVAWGTRRVLPAILDGLEREAAPRLLVRR